MGDLSVASCVVILDCSTQPAYPSSSRISARPLTRAAVFRVMFGLL